MDGFSSAGDVVVIAASNLLEKLDPALMRPGRFDRQVFVSPPDVEGRKAILAVHTRNKPLDKDVDFERIARQTSGLTGAELANIANEAAIAAARGMRPRLQQGDFEYALERVDGRHGDLARAERARAPHRRLPRGRACADHAPAARHDARSSACRSSRAAGRSATSSTCRRRTASSTRAPS